MSKSSIELLKANPELHAKAIELSIASRNLNIPAAARAACLLELSDLMAPLILEAARLTVHEYLNRPAFPVLPQYKYVRGARVRVS